MKFSIKVNIVICLIMIPMSLIAQKVGESTCFPKKQMIQYFLKGELSSNLTSIDSDYTFDIEIDVQDVLLDSSYVIYLVQLVIPHASPAILLKKKENYIILNAGNFDRDWPYISNLIKVANNIQFIDNLKVLKYLELYIKLRTGKRALIFDLKESLNDIAPIYFTFNCR